MSSELIWHGPEVIKKMAQATEAGLTACAMQVHGQAVLLTPVITSRLKNSLTYRVGKFKSNISSPAQPEDEITTEPTEGEAIIGTNVFYAAGVELGNPPHDIPNAFGWGIVAHHPGNAPRSYLRKALDTVSKQLDSIFSKEYNRVMK